VRDGGRAAGRAGAGALRLVVCLVVCLAPWAGRAARAQEGNQKETRTLTEPELKAARDRASDTYVRANAHLQAARSTFEEQREKRGRLLADQRRLEAESAGFIRDYQLERVRQDLRRVADDLREAQHQLEDARSEERVRRLELIRASWAWVTRLLEVADRVAEERPIDSQRLASTANEELRLIENLEHGVEPVPPVEVPPPEDPKTLPDEQLERLVVLFADLADRAAERARDLAPERAKLEERVQRLDRLVNDRKVRELSERLDRARADLAQVASLVEEETQRAADYRARVAALEKERSERPTRPPEEPR
jgi:hypothetical protein